jgi:hypothetical protein
MHTWLVTARPHCRTGCIRVTSGLNDAHMEAVQSTAKRYPSIFLSERTGLAFGLSSQPKTVVPTALLPIAEFGALSKGPTMVGDFRLLNNCSAVGLSSGGLACFYLGLRARHYYVCHTGLAR